MPVSIHKALSSQDEIKDSKEKASVSSELKQKIGVNVGDQIRIEKLDTGIVGAFTVWEIHDDSSKPVRMGARGRKKTFNTSSTFNGTISGTVPENQLTFQEAWRKSRSIETTWHEPEQDQLIALAPHGADMEACTDQIAVELYKNMPANQCSIWAYHGFGDDAGDRFHIKSHRVQSQSYPGLAEVSNTNFQRAIAFHIKKDAEKIEVGGLTDRQLRKDIAATVEEAVNEKWETELEYDEGTYMGQKKANVVNRLTADGQSGVQIELPIYAARNYRKRIARNLAEWFQNSI